MAQKQKSYDNEFKAQAVKLAQEIGGHKAAQELGIERSSDQSRISTMERLKQAQKRSGQIRTQREKSSLAMERAW